MISFALKIYHDASQIVMYIVSVVNYTLCKYGIVYHLSNMLSKSFL